VTSHLFDTGTGTERNSSEVEGLDARGITDVSPSGKYLVAVQKTFDFASGNQRGTVRVWDTVAQTTVVKDIAPPAQQSWRDGPLVTAKMVGKNADSTWNGVVWAGFMAEDRLLTLTGHGGFDIWTLPGMLPKYRVEGMRDHFDNLVRLNRMWGPSLSPFPRGFALSADRKTLARFTGDGFQFFDTATGERKAETEKLSVKDQPVPGRNMKLAPEIVGMAFNPRGVTLAAAYHVPIAGRNHLVLFDPITGNTKSGGGRLASLFTAVPGNNVRWWGKYLLMSEFTKVTSFDPSTGEMLAQIHPQSGGAFLQDTRDGLLWVFGPPTPGGPPCIYSLAAPPTLPDASHSVTATPDGLVERPR